jgi:hypothetical protein
MEYLWSVSKSGAVAPRKYNVKKETQKTYVLDDGTIVRKATMENTYQNFYTTELDAKFFYWHLRSMYGFDEMDEEPEFNVDAIKESTFASLPKTLLNMIYDLCEDGVPTEQTIMKWLLTKPGKWSNIADE